MYKNQSWIQPFWIIYGLWIGPDIYKSPRKTVNVFKGATGTYSLSFCIMLLTD